ncbi:hypothetical protein GGR53DRAFT_520511 [Hypoxylon sp. FL1150]|nr:hypothetical protein GGR53DRAFT_520511 [Hypoxylon sp. FL1150]
MEPGYRLLDYRYRRRRQKWESDDWTILGALILTIGITIDILIMTRYGGLGTHSQYDDNGSSLDPEAIVIFGKTTYALEIITWPAVGLTKISVLLMYNRIFTSPRFKTTIWILIGLVSAWTVAFTFALMFSCTPIASQWDFSLEYTCVDQEALFATALVTDVALDLLVLAIPIYKTWQLQMPLPQKAAILCIFLMGGLVSIAGIIRICLLCQIYSTLDDSPDSDNTWLYAPVFYWTIIKANVGVMSPCLSTLSPLQARVARYLPIAFFKIRDSATYLLSSADGNEGGTSLDPKEDENLDCLESSCSLSKALCSGRSKHAFHPN